MLSEISSWKKYFGFFPLNLLIVKREVIYVCVCVCVSVFTYLFNQISANTLLEVFIVY